MGEGEERCWRELLLTDGRRQPEARPGGPYKGGCCGVWEPVSCGLRKAGPRVETAALKERKERPMRELYLRDTEIRHGYSLGNQRLSWGMDWAQH